MFLNFVALLKKVIIRSHFKSIYSKLKLVIFGNKIETIIFRITACTSWFLIDQRLNAEFARGWAQFDRTVAFVHSPDGEFVAVIVWRALYWILKGICQQ